MVSCLQRLVRRKAADATKQRSKVFSVDVFHGEKVLPIDFFDVIDPADIWVRNLTGVAYFRPQAGNGHGVLLQ
jgi:hypothetical protein